MTEWQRISDTAPRDSVEELESELVGSLRAPPGAREAVWQRVSGALVVAGAASTLSAQSAASSAAPSLLAKGALVVGLVAPLAGGLAYWTTRDGAPETRSTAAASVAAPQAQPVPAENAAPAPVVAARAAEPVVAAAPAASSPVQGATVSSSRLAEENRLLRAARAAFRSGDRSGALAQLTLLDQSFPHGALLQEREYLRVQLAFAQGAPESARAMGRRFLQAYPKSPYGAHVESLLQAGAR